MLVRPDDLEETLGSLRADGASTPLVKGSTLMSLRSLIDRIRNRDPEAPPPGVTHVLAHVPSSMMDCRYACPAEASDHSHPDGFWELWTTNGYRQGYEDDGDCPSGWDGPAAMPAPDLAACAEEILGFPVALAWFETEIPEDGGIYRESAYYITPAGSA